MIQIAFLEHQNAQRTKQITIDALKEKQLLQAEKAKNTILYSIEQKTRACQETSAKLTPELTAQEGVVELTPQSQLDSALDVVKATDHIIKLYNSERTVGKPRLTMSQNIAVSYLKSMRERNVRTFDHVLKLVTVHSKGGCKLTKSGELIHSPKCTDTATNGSELIRVFQLGMMELQPALRHAMVAFFSRDLRTPSVDYAWVLTRTSADFYRPKKRREGRTSTSRSESSDN